MLAGCLVAVLVAVPGADDPGLPGGTEVSRPLTPVEVPPAAESEAVTRVEELGRPVRRGPLGPSWNSQEYLFWWPKAHPLPPLVSDSAGALLAGGRALGTPGVSGGRFTLGWAADPGQTRGYEVVYFFLGSRTDRFTAGAQLPTIGVPFANAVTGREDVFPAPVPGAVTVATTTRVQGAEANAVGNLFDRDGVRLNGLAGYRFLQAHEGLTVTTARPGGAVYDEFVAHNRFHGGQVGLHADLTRGTVFCELTGKVALGGTFEVVRVDGATGPGFVFVPGGLFTGPTNIGRATRTAFAVVPEGTLKLGFRWGEAGRVYVGYNFLYLSDAVRPGDQLDRVVNPANVPALGGGTGGFPDRPRPLFNRSDFWAQGLVIGLETRY
ncbi:MAG: hypothetical protein C0501_19645 [Isosphaera sp.]|nr:hypothetical protein [Isosphaera sp.]